MRIEIPSTDATPYVLIDFANSVVEFAGESFPEDAAMFYEPLLSKIKEHLESNRDLNLAVNFKLSYFNSSSNKFFYKLFNMFEDASEFHKIGVNWYHLEEDDMSKEAGEAFSEEVEHIPFSFYTLESL